MEYTVYPSLIFVQLLLYSLIMTPFLTSLRIKNGRLYYISSDNYKLCIIILGVLFSVFASYDGDWYHYIPAIKLNYFHNDPYTHLESSHLWIIKNLSFGSYLWWRLLVWGTSYWFIWLSLKRIGQDNLLTWTCIMAVCLIQLCISRTTLGIALLFYGFVCILKPKLKVWSALKGIILMICSLALHKSLFIYFMASIIALLHFRKWMLIMLLCLLPIVINIFTNILAMYFFAGELSHSAEGYLSGTTIKNGIGINLYIYSLYSILLIIFCLFYKFQNIKTYNKHSFLENLWQNNYNIYFIYLITWGALTVNQIGNNDISLRILWGIYIPSSILISCMIRNNYKTSLNIILVLGLFISGFYRLLYAYYLQNIGSGV